MHTLIQVRENNVLDRQTVFVFRSSTWNQEIPLKCILWSEIGGAGAKSRLNIFSISSSREKLIGR